VSARLRRPLRLAALAALVFALAACGVKGPLEPPPGATPAQTTAAPSPDAPSLRARRPPPPERPDQPFVLDSLL
jgi:predicted small lipoprotein YifL